MSRSYQTCVKSLTRPNFLFLLDLSALYFNYMVLVRKAMSLQKGPWRWLLSNRCLVYFSLSDRKCPYKYHFLYNESVCIPVNMKINILFLKKWRQRKKRTIPCISTYSCCLSRGERIWILEDGTEQNLIHFLWRTSFILADKICPILRCLTRSAVISLAGVPPIQISPQTWEGHVRVIYLYRLPVNVTSQRLLVEEVWCCGTNRWIWKVSSKNCSEIFGTTELLDI